MTAPGGRRAVDVKAVAAFVVLYLALGWVSASLPSLGVVSPWWLPSTLGMWMVLRRGHRWLPVNVGTEVALGVVVLHDSLDAALLVVAVANALAYALPALYLRRRHGPGLDVQRLPVLVAAWLAGALGAVIAATTGTALMIARGMLPASELVDGALVWAAGDIVGIVCLLPVLQLVTAALPERRWRLTWAVVLDVIAAPAAALAVVAAVDDPGNVLFVLFLPVAWAGLRRGLLHAATAAFVSSAAVALLMGSAGNDALSIGYVQLLVITLSAAGCCVGAIADENRQMRTELEARVRARTDALEAANVALQHAAFHDPLTGLANRALLGDRVNHALALHVRTLRPLAVLFCDIDDFKTVNDTMGHDVGDRLLTGIATRMRSCVRESDTLARLGGDEFAILVEGDDADGRVVAARISAALAAPFLVEGRRIQLSTSIGILPVDADSATPDAADVLTRADVAMYAAKRGGKNRTVVWGPDIVSADADELTLRADLAQALAERQLTVVYQPIVDAVSGRTVEVEALARWTHSSGIEIPTARFIPLAERAGVLGLLSDVVLERAIQQLAVAEQEFGAPGLRLAVNLAPEQLRDTSFPDRVQRLLSDAGVPASRLTLEITEERLALDEEGHARRALERLAGLGVRLALDDFGVGYSGLALLHELPITTIKIDRLFITSADARSTAFITGMVGLADDLSVSTVAEGVETDDQLALVRALGCDYIQGYLTGRPRRLRLPLLGPASTTTEAPPA